MYKYNAIVKKIVDGDTMDLTIDLGFRIKTDIRVRLSGIDAPETFRPKSAGEKQHAKECVEFINSLNLIGSSVVVTTKKTGKYGRWIAEINIMGRDLASMLIDRGFQKRASYQ